MYAVEDVGEAAIVAELLRRGVRRADVRRLVGRLGAELGAWPLGAAALATAGRRVYRREDDGLSVLTARGWQEIAVAPDGLRDVRLRLSGVERRP